MAKLLIRKIYTTRLSQSRSYSGRMELVPQSSTRIAAADNITESLIDDSGAHGIRYNVCREPGGKKKFTFEKRPKLPEEPIEVSTNVVDPQHSNQDTITMTHKGYRAFDVSVTQRNTILPLKMSKLAKPFPDPVKVMPSHTVSDQDKADQAQAEFRVPRSVTRKSRI